MNASDMHALKSANCQLNNEKNCLQEQLEEAKRKLVQAENEMQQVNEKRAMEQQHAQQEHKHLTSEKMELERKVRLGCVLLHFLSCTRGNETLKRRLCRIVDRTLGEDAL